MALGTGGLNGQVQLTRLIGPVPFNFPNSVVGSTYLYKNLFGTQSTTLGSEQVTDALLINVKFTFSSGSLLPAYNKILESRGLGPLALNNAFTFTLNPAFF
jgi:hypothetical protein